MTFCYTTVYTTVALTDDTCAHLQRTPIKLTITSKLLRNNVAPTSHFCQWCLCRLHWMLFYLPSWIVVTGWWSICRWWSLEQLVLILSWLLQLTGEKRQNEINNRTPYCPQGPWNCRKGMKPHQNRQISAQSSLPASWPVRERSSASFSFSLPVFFYFSPSLSLYCTTTRYPLFFPLHFKMTLFPAVPFALPI